MNKKKHTFIVTGAAGFVGSHLSQQLLSLGHGVVGVDNFFSGKPENMAGFIHHPRFVFHNRSILESGLIKEISLQHPIEAVFHLAAVVSVPYSVNHPEKTFQINHDATLNLLKETEQTSAKAFVFAGSAAEYGEEQRLPVKESYASDQTVQASSYGQSKFKASMATARSTIGIALRFFNIFGPRQDPSSPYSGVVSKFIQASLNKQNPVIYGDGNQTRDFVFIDDVVRAYLLAADWRGKKSSAHDIYNVGTGQQTSILNLARLVMRIAQYSGEAEFQPPRQGDIRHSVADIAKIRDQLGWKPGVSLENGLKTTIKWMQKDRISNV